MSKWKVYISSTFRDLKDFRAELINLFQNQLKNNFELCEIMERMFDDGTYTPFVNDCVEAVLESDIYIIILGNKIGSFPPHENRTYTEIELDTALTHDKKIFCLHLNEFNEAEIDNKEKHNELLGKFKGRPIHAFKDAKDLKTSLYEFLIQFTSESPVNKKNPYKGLASFNVDDGEYFFGRDAELESCIKKICTSSGNFFVSVIGNSGTGKSSFVKAGLMYRLKHKKEFGFSERKQIIVTPANEPFTNLKYQMQLQGVSIDDVLNPNSETPGLLIFFDQFEEVITQCHSLEAQEERKQLFEFLDALTNNQNKHSKVLVICTFRSDFLSQLANFHFIKSYQYLFPISSLDYKVHADNWEQSMTEIISWPALKNGVVFEKELVEQLLQQIKEVDGSLPILQFTLERLWSKDTIGDRRINSTEFNKLSEGKGISGIIETHAENVVKSITKKGQDKEREAILKTIFVNLVEVNQNQNDVKRTVSKVEIFSILKQHPEQTVNDVFEILVSEKSRLLNIGQDKDDTINVGIIHEELIRKWERLKGWINERREALETKKRILLDIAAFKKGEEGLYGRTQLKRANQWKTNNPDLVNEEINTFLLKARRSNNNSLYKYSGITLLAAALITIVVLVLVQPAIQKRDFEKILSKNFPELNNNCNNVGGCKFLAKLIINQANSSFLDENIKFFNNITHLEINGSTFIDLAFFQNIKYPNKIDTLTISNNNSLESLKGIQGLKSLTSLSIENNKSIKNLEGIQELKSLNSLAIISNDSLESLKGIQNLKSLTSLRIFSNQSLKGQEDIPLPQSLTTLTIEANDKIINFDEIAELQSLSSLAISYTTFKDLKGIQVLKSLSSLALSWNFNLESLEGIKELRSLTSLTFDNCNIFMSLEGIHSLNSLNSLKIGPNYNILSFQDLHLPITITSLSIEGFVNLQSLIGIKELKFLTSLSINNNNSLKSLNGIQELQSLTTLKINGNNDLESIESIKELKTITSLTISNNKKVQNFGSIKNLKSLKELELTELNYSPEILYELKNLEKIVLDKEVNADLKKIRHKNPGIKILYE